MIFCKSAEATLPLADALTVVAFVPSTPSGVTSKRNLSTVVPSGKAEGTLLMNTATESPEAKSTGEVAVAENPGNVIASSCGHVCGAATSSLKSSSQETVVKATAVSNV